MENTIEEEFERKVRDFVSGRFGEGCEEDGGREDGEALGPEPEGKGEEEGHAGAVA